MKAEAMKPRAMKRWLKRLVWLFAALLLLLASLAAWLLGTESGARFALRFAPAGLHIESVTGTLSGPMQISGLRYQESGTEVQLGRANVELLLRSLLSNQVVINDLSMDGLRIVLSGSGAAKPASQEGNSKLPSFTIRRLNLTNVSVVRADTTLAEFAVIRAKAVLAQADQIRFDDLHVEEKRGVLDVNGLLDLSGVSPSDVRVGFSSHTLPGVSSEVALTGTLSGTPMKMRVNLELSKPQPVQLQAELSNVLSADLRWTGRVFSDGVSLEDFGVKGPIKTVAGELQGSGSLGNAQLTGTVRLDQDAFALRALGVDWHDATQLTLSAFTLGLPTGGELSASGSWPITQVAASEKAVDGALSLRWRDLQLPVRFGWPQGLSSAEGKVDVRGETENFAADIALVLARAVPEEATLGASLTGKLSRAGNQITLAPLRIENTDGGNLTLTGDLQLADEASPGLRWKVAASGDRLNPALLAADWPGSLELSLQSEGVYLNQKLNADLSIDQLGGDLKGQALRGQGKLKFVDSFQPIGELKLHWGVNAVDFLAQSVSDLQVNLDIADLSAVTPDASGSVQGGLTLRQGSSGMPSLDGALQARLLRAGSLSAETVDVRAIWPADRRAPIALSVHSGSIQFNEQQISSIKLTLDGTRGAHSLSASVESKDVALELAAQGGLIGKSDATSQWSGMLSSLVLTPTQRDAKAPSPLRLRAPSALRVGRDNVQLSEACFDGIGAAFCANLQWAKRGKGKATVLLSELDLAALQSAMHVADGISLQGVLQGQFNADFLDGALLGYDGVVQPVSTKPLKATVARDDNDDVNFEFTEFEIAATSVKGMPSINARVNLKDAGSIVAKDLILRGDILSGQLEIDLSSLKAFNGLSESLVNPSGRVAGALRLEGSSAAPLITGSINAEALSMELPGAGLKISGGKLALTSDGSRLNVDGAFTSGDGTLKVLGWVAPFAKAKMQLNLEGENVLLADIPSARVVASPALAVAHDGSQIKITGALTVPSANLQLDRFESGVARSEDVVVTDDVKPEPGTPIRADLTVSLGENVALKGFGLNGKLKGRLKIRERPNRTGTARGEIEVTGTYKAYGQDLLIERGKLLYSSTPLDDPGLDIRAVRKVDAIKAGVQVRGTALRPELTVWSEPVMEQSDALSYVVLGRPLKGASGADSALVGQAANALGTAGGNLLAKGLGQKVGLELGVETLSDIGGPAFTAGKYLSPSLYVGYGQGLFNPQTLFILRYKLFEHYELEALSGREQKVGVNYRRER